MTTSKQKFSEDWIDGYSVMITLNISVRTLARYRANNTLPFSRIGGRIYYNKSEIEKIMKNNSNTSPTQLPYNSH